MNRSVLVSVLVLWCGLRAASLHAQEQVDPAVRERLDREFAAAEPQPGDYLPDLELPTLGGRETSIRHAAYGDLTIVVTGSFTCPKTRRHMPALQELKKKYGKQLGVTVVYVIEAHPEIDVCPYLGVVDVTEANLRDKILHRQPTTTVERLAIVKTFHNRYPIEAAVLIDSMDNVAWRALGRSPNAALLVDRDDKVILRQGWFDPEKLEEEIAKRLPEPVKEEPDPFKEKDEEGWRAKESGPDKPPQLANRKPTRAKPEIKRDPNEDVENAEPSEALKEILERLARKSEDRSPHIWDFVRWLEKVNNDKLRQLFKEYPTVVNERLTYGPHNQYRASILQLMIKRDDLEKVEIVCEAGASVNLIAREDTPLTTAIERGNLAIVDYLLRHGADPNICRVREQDSTLRYAILKGHTAIAERLIEAGIKHDIFSLCGLGLVNDVQRQLDEKPERGLKFDKGGNIPLSYAVAGNQPSVVRLLLDRKMAAEVGDRFNEPPVLLAVRKPDTQILGMLLQHGMSPDASYGGALRLAIELDHFDHFKRLVEAKANLGFYERGRTPLHVISSRALRPEYAQVLLDNGAEIDALTKGYSDDGCGPEDPRSTKETPLHVAARNLQAENVAILLAAKAKTDGRDTSKLTPLAAAIVETLLEEKPERGLVTIKAMIDGGCSVDVADSKGKDVRETIAAVLRNPSPKKGSMSERNPPKRYDLPPYLVAPTHWLGPIGLNATKLPASPLVKEIHQLLSRGAKAK